MSNLKSDKYIKAVDGKYDVRVTAQIKGAPPFERRMRGIADKPTARYWANKFLAERDQYRKSAKEGLVSWKNAVVEWEKFAIKKQLSDTTIHSAKLTLEKHTSCWANRAVTSINTSEVEALIHKALDASPIETKLSLLKHIRNVFNRQKQLGKIETNPCNGIYLGKKPKKELVAMTREEIKKLFKEAIAINHPWYPVWRITYELGLRAGEAFALKWSDINFESGFVTVQRSYSKVKKGFKSPKNGKSRAVPLNKALKEFMLELRDNTTEKEFVFERNTIWRHGEQSKVLSEFQRHLGIRETNFHSLRASFITHLLLAGEPLLKVKAMVGHERTETSERYMRLVAADTIGATDAIGFKD